MTLYNKDNKHFYYITHRAPKNQHIIQYYKINPRNKNSCLICGCVFYNDHYNVKYCSDECLWKAGNDRNRKKSIGIKENFSFINRPFHKVSGKPYSSRLVPMMKPYCGPMVWRNCLLGLHSLCRKKSLSGYMCGCSCHENEKGY